MERRNTIQKELVLNAVLEMRRHVTAEEVYDYVKEKHPSIGKGTVYRNLNTLVEEEKIRRIEISGGADYFDFMLEKHYHAKCIRCGNLFDVDMDEIKELASLIHDRHGFEFLDYDILFKGICKDCKSKDKEENNG